MDERSPAWNPRRLLAAVLFASNVGMGLTAQEAWRRDEIQRLTALRATGPGDAAMVDALVSADLTWVDWRDAMRAALGPDARHAELLDALWLDQPGRRRARARAFARSPASLIARFIDGDATERDDVLACAAWLGDLAVEVRRARSSTRTADERDACTALLRAAARHDRETVDPFLAQLELLGEADPEALQIHCAFIEVGNATSFPRLRLARSIRAHDDFVSVRNAALLCRTAGLKRPPWIARQLLRDPSTAVREFATNLPVDADEVTTRILPALLTASGEAEQRLALMRLSHTESELPPAHRGALLRAVLALSTQSGRPIEPIRTGPLLALLADRDPALTAQVLEFAAAQENPLWRTGAVDALMAIHPPSPAIVSAISEQVAALLALRDPDVDFILFRRMEADDRWLDQGPIHAALVPRALELLATLEARDGRDAPLRERDASRLLLAALRHDPHLVEALLDAIEPCLHGVDLDTLRDHGSEGLVNALESLRALLPYADETSIRRAYALLAPVAAPAIEACGDRATITRAAIGLARTWCLLWTRAPDALADTFGIEEYAPWRRARFAIDLGQEELLVSEPRALALLEGVSLKRSARRVWIRAPELVGRVWRERPREHQELASGLAWLLREDPALVCATLRDAGLPAELVTHALGEPVIDAPSQLRRIAFVLSHADLRLARRLGHGWASRVGLRIREAGRETAATDLEACAAITSSAPPIVCIAAARRAFALGDEGRALALRTLAAQVGSRDPVVVDALCHAAVDLGVEFDGLADDARRRLDPTNPPPRRSWAHAVLVRSGDLTIESIEPRHAVATLEVLPLEVDVDRLRRLIAGDPRIEAAELVARGSSRTRQSALTLAAERPEWSTQLEREVVQACVDPDPAVRRAAYAALRTRDPDLDPCRALLSLAALDPEPDLRGLAN